MPPYLATLDRLCNSNGSRPKDDPKERREDEEHQREHHLDGRLMGRFLSTLAPPCSHLVGLHTQYLSDTDTKLLGLNNGVDEAGQFLNSQALLQLDHGFLAELAHGHVAQHLRELS